VNVEGAAFSVEFAIADTEAPLDRDKNRVSMIWKTNALCRTSYIADRVAQNLEIIFGLLVCLYIFANTFA